MWRAKLCGDIGGGARWQLALDGGEAGLFSKLVALGSGAAVRVEGGLAGVMALGLMADRYQVEAVQGAVEEAVVGLLTVERCGGVLAWSSGSGLERVARASREVALREFDEFARTAGFMEVGREALGSLLEDEGLWTILLALPYNHNGKSSRVINWPVKSFSAAAHTYRSDSDPPVNPFNLNVWRSMTGDADGSVTTVTRSAPAAVVAHRRGPAQLLLSS